MAVFGPEVPPLILFNDESIALNAKNNEIAFGGMLNYEAKALRSHQHRGRPLFHFWGGVQTTNAPTLYRFVRFNFLDGGGQAMESTVGYVPFTGTPTDNQGVRLTRNAATNYDTFIPSTPSIATNPEDVTAAKLAGVSQTAISGVPEGYAFGPRDGNSPYLTSGCLYEDYVPFCDPDLTVTEGGFKMGADILGTKSGASSTISRLQERFRHVWRFRRPHIGWSEPDPDNNAIIFAESRYEYRYIFDQTIGDGGTDPSDAGPCITLPLQFSASQSRRDQIRVYVWVYAFMSPDNEGTLGTGSLAVANKDAGAVMGDMTALANNITITGTTPQWYPAMGAFNPATYPYFMGCESDVFDRIQLGARQEDGGATGMPAIGAFMFLPFQV